MPARRPLRSSFPQPSQKQSPVPRVCATVGGGLGGLDSRRPHGKSPARPPPLLGLVGDPWSSAGLEGWEKDGRVFDRPTSAAVRQHCGRCAIKREILVVPFRLTIAMSSGWFQPTTTPGCTASSSSISRLWQKWNAPLRSGPRHRPLSTLGLCPCPPRALPQTTKLTSMASWSVATTVFPRLEKNRHLGSSRPRRSCWGRWDCAVHSPNSAVRRIITNGSSSNGTSLAPMRLQTQGNCPWCVCCFPPPTHPRVPCNSFKIGKPLSRP